MVTTPRKKTHNNTAPTRTSRTGGVRPAPRQEGRRSANSEETRSEGRRSAHSERSTLRRPNHRGGQSASSVIKKTYEIIQNHVILRNFVLALCFGIILYFITNLCLEIYTRHGQKFIVPSMVGHTISEAEKMALEGELNLTVIDSLYMPKQKPGVILDQSPKSGMGVKSGRSIFITTNAFRPRTDIIPYIAGYSLRQAKNVLENRGFEIEKLVYRSDIATNNVLDELFKGKSIVSGSRIEAELGSKITLVVGVNHSSPLPRIPKVIGLTLREAKSRLWEIGLNIGRIRYDTDVPESEIENARVYRQSPNQQSRSDYGGSISLWLTLDTKKISSYSKSSDAETRKYAVDQEQIDAAAIRDSLSRLN